ncbi:MAG: mechanosensitive ion channel [Flavisolibacter sp.]|nr:mechanosensitive ion channel [Flavisolibacter sp.]MBD0374028.1 mechanosensitive ion channel [Flavisolibacter sp.]
MKGIYHAVLLFFVALPFGLLHAQQIPQSADSSRPDAAATDTSATATAADAAQLLSRLNQVYITLNRINYTTGTKLNVQDIEKELANVTDHLRGLKENLSAENRTLTVSTLQMYEILIVEMLGDLEEWRELLQDYEDKLRYMTTRLDTIRNDSAFRRLRRNEALRAQYGEQLKAGRQKFRTADSTLKLSLAKINTLQTRISEDYIEVTEARNKVRRQLRAFTNRTFTKEAPYLWEIGPKTSYADIKSKAARSYVAERNAMGYYFSKRYWNRVFLLLTGLLFFAWVAYNFRVTKKLGLESLLRYFKFLRPVPVIASLLVVFILSPFFDLNAPAVYTEIMQLGLLAVLTVFFAVHWPRGLFAYWMGIVVLFLLFAFSRTMVTPGFGERGYLLLLNAVAAGYTALFLKRLQRRKAFEKFVRAVLLTGITLNIAAVLFNIFGRTTLAQTLGSTSVFSLTQIVGLAVFIQVMSEAFYLQVRKSRLVQHLHAPVSYEQVAPRFRNLLTLVVLMLWAIVFASNLHVYGPIYKNVSRFLRIERHLGSTAFTYGNLLVFAGVLWVSFILQKFTGYFMGIVDDHNEMNENIGRKGNRLLFIRLVIVIAGFLLAVAASGLPVDKLTIVFSALGVGIGLGLQNIVNNFVSGIILIFERPFHIGDTIEIGGKLGRVKNISVRSSVIHTDKGAEIIVPNGDLLSQQVINWTLTNRHVLAELRLILTGSPNFRMVKSLVLDMLKGHPELIAEKEPQVLIEEITHTGLSLLIQFWIKDISNVDEIQSEIKTKIYTCFREHELQLSAHPVTYVKQL